MEMKENNVKAVLFFVIFVMTLLKLLRWIVGQKFIDYWNTMLFSELCIFVLVITVNQMYFRIPLAFKRKYWKTGLFLGLPTLIPTLVNYFQIKQAPPWMLTSKIFMLSLLVGGFEELLFRGILLRTLVTKWHHLRYGPLLALVASSMVFGAAHLTNLTQQSLLATIYQIEFAFSLGMILGAVYLRSHNLFLPVFLHALIDSGAFLANWMNKSMAMQSPAAWMLVTGIIIFAPYYLLGALYVRPSKKAVLLR